MGEWPIEIAVEFTKVANAIEAFSTYFVSGVADEEVAYLSIGTTFCNSVTKIAPILVFLGDKNNSYSCTLHLLSIWGARLQSDLLKRQKEDIEEQLKEYQSMTIQTVGTDT
ncbi:MAG: hypothetical protein MN733_26735 [Nitrososphaera sp.]|nr:hypothetical protein [Nitrososphaera sp.]